MTKLESEFQAAIIVGVVLGIADNYHLDEESVKELINKQEEI